MENFTGIKDSNEFKIFSEKDEEKESLSEVECFQKIIEVKRIARTAKSGIFITYRAIIIIGDSNNMVGIGIGYSEESSKAIKKAFVNGKQNLISVSITNKKSISHLIKVIDRSCKIILRPTSEGNGVIASRPIKTLMEYAGIKNITCKQFGSNNILSNIKVALLALRLLKEKIELAKTRSNKNYNFYTKTIKI